jgi:sarcosine oxidase subunit alpha
MDAGAEFGITPYGTETMHVLRAEKGYVIVGQDTDGSVTPMDLGVGRMVSTRKDFLGKRSLKLEHLISEQRKQFVGLLPEDENTVLPEGGQIVKDQYFHIPAQMIGHVTSSYYSATLGRSISLGVVKDGRSMEGEMVHVPMQDGSVIGARVTSPVFYDPGGKRQDVE